MGRYTPSIQIDRRRKLVSPNDNDVVRVAMLGVFMILLAFFVALVANTKPSEQKTVDVMATLQNTFKPTSGLVGNNLSAPPEIPGWLDSGDSINASSPLDDLKREFPQAFSGAQNNWGSLELRFTSDMFQSFIFTDNELARRFFSGLSQPLNTVIASDPYILEVTFGLQGNEVQAAQNLLQKTRENLMEFGVEPSRMLLGFESSSDAIIVRLTPYSRYEGAL